MHYDFRFWRMRDELDGLVCGTLVGLLVSAAITVIAIVAS